MTMNEQIEHELKKLLEADGYGLELFISNGQVVIDPFVDETGRDAISPVEYYGTEKVLEAMTVLIRSKRTTGGGW